MVKVSQRFVKDTLWRFLPSPLLAGIGLPYVFTVPEAPDRRRRPETWGEEGG